MRDVCVWKELTLCRRLASNYFLSQQELGEQGKSCGFVVQAAMSIDRMDCFNLQEEPERAAGDDLVLAEISTLE